MGLPEDRKEAFGRAVFSLAVSLAIMFVIYLMLLAAAPSGAQNVGATVSSTRGSTSALGNDARNQNRRMIVVEEQTIIRRTIPRKGLPPTGGSAVYAMIGGSVLTGAGLLAVGIATRRGRRG